MSKSITDGRYLAQKSLFDLSNIIDVIKKNYSLIPKLAIIQVGSDPASEIYVNNKLRAANQINMDALKISFPIDLEMKMLLETINNLNKDKTISGIIVQLPLPTQINKDQVMSYIDPAKDVDGFHPLNVGYLHSGIKKGFVPSTALGCLDLIKHQIHNLSSLNAVILSRSQIVGKPLSALLLTENATVTVCHSYTKNLMHYTYNADIVITAIGKPKFLNASHFNNNAIVIDVGISKIPGTNKIVGDVDYLNTYDKVKYLSPVPGGVGPLTVSHLLKNTFKAFALQNKLESFLND